MSETLTIESSILFVVFKSGGSEGKESTCNAGDPGSILGSEDTLEESMATHSRILAWSIPMGRGAWWTTVHGVWTVRVGHDCTTFPHSLTHSLTSDSEAFHYK